MDHEGIARRARKLGRAGALVVVLALAGCGGPPPATPAAPPTAPAKLLVIVEENHGYDQVIASPDAPYLSQLATTYGKATHYDAGYPARCPSLAAYVLMTSGTTAGVCDDRGPNAHPLTGDNVFHQVTAAGLTWRAYAEAAPRSCALTDSADGRYLVRHVPATYYVDERPDCARWAVPLGTPSAGALHDDVAAGRLPAYAFVIPDACDDMHGAPPCPGDLVATGDRWLRTWLTQILAGPDYRAGRLAIVVTFDEGTGSDNHIPTVVVSPSTDHRVVSQPFTHCSLLRTTEDLLRLPPLGCAGSAASLSPAFGL